MAEKRRRAASLVLDTLLAKNYRSTRYIIEAANRLIGNNADRMKTEHPIRIDRHREMLPAGGEFGHRDPVAGGKVQVIQVQDIRMQAEATVAEVQRLHDLGVSNWSQIAVLSSTHRELALVRTLMEAAKIPIRWVAQRDKMVPLHQIRELRRFLLQLQEARNQLMRASELSNMAAEMFGQGGGNPWVQFLADILETWRQESSDSELPVYEALEFLYEACAESRREFTYGDGVTLSTVHSSKGTEYDHVLLIGTWPARQDRTKLEESRRALYVGMTRARKTLTIVDRQDVHPSLAETLTGPAVNIRRFTTKANPEPHDFFGYETLSLEDIHLGYPGKYREGSPVHEALGRLSPGDTLAMRSLEGNGIGLFDKTGVCVARLSRKGDAEWGKRLASIREVRVLAMARRTAAQDAEQARREQYQVKEWEIPVVEVVCEENAKD